MAAAQSEHKQPDPEENLDGCPDAYFCPITRAIMINPVTLISDGHTYEASAIQQWFQISGRRLSPMTGQRVRSTNTTPNHTLRKAINEFLDTYPEHKAKEMELQSLKYAIKLREQDLQSMLAKQQSVTHNELNEAESKSNLVDKMDVQVIQFLTKLGESEYIPLFAKNGVYTMNTMKLLTKDELKEVIPGNKVGPRAVINNAIQILIANDSNPPQANQRKTDEENEEKTSTLNEVTNKSMSNMSDADLDDLQCAKCGADCESAEQQDEGYIDRIEEQSFVWYCGDCCGECRVCDKKLKKDAFHIVDNVMCCDDCVKWCSKHNTQCLITNGEVSFATQSWYCYKCMVQCSCGVWWRPNELNYYQKGSAVNVRCVACNAVVRL